MMTKEQYITKISDLLEQCNEEKVLYYIMTLLQELV
jgi:hypothetical protein